MGIVRSKSLSRLILFALASQLVRAQEFTAIVHGEVIDGNGGTPIRNGVVNACWCDQFRSKALISAI